ncbi:MAG: hypothetical protein IV107_02675 [Paucibacter sp.]|nr:hypothetical protein [Roseateles sp.]
MSKLLDDVLTQLPLWLGKFTQSLTHPSEVLAEHMAAESGPKPVHDGASFLILSFALAAALAIAFPVASMTALGGGKPEGALAQSALVLRGIFVFLAAAAVAHGATRLLGSRAQFSACFGTVARFGGATLVLLSLANAVTNVSMADPVVARNWHELRLLTEAFAAPMETVLCKFDPKTGQLPPGTDLGAFNPETLLKSQTLFLETVTRPMYLIATGLSVAILSYLAIWLAWVWWRYLKAIGLSAPRAIAATVIAATGLAAGELLLVLIDGGQMSSQLMQGC